MQHLEIRKINRFRLASLVNPDVVVVRHDSDQLDRLRDAQAREGVAGFQFNHFTDGHDEREYSKLPGR